jgi:hypothetical protein
VIHRHIQKLSAKYNPTFINSKTLPCNETFKKVAKVKQSKFFHRPSLYIVYLSTILDSDISHDQLTDGGKSKVFGSDKIGNNNRKDNSYYLIKHGEFSRQIAYN